MTLRFKFVVIELMVIVTLFPSMRATDLGDVTMKIYPEQIVVPLHQPLDVVLTLQNSSAQVANIDLGDNRNRNLLLTVITPEGTKHNLRIAGHEGLARIGRISLSAGQTYSQHLLLNEWLDFGTVGIYRVSVALSEPVTFPDGRTRELSPSVVRARITEWDEKELARFCDQALQTLLVSTSYQDAEKAALILSYTKDRIAVPYLVRAFDTRYPVQSLLVTGLERIGTSTSIRELSALAREGVVATEAKRALSELLNRTSDPELRHEIQQVLEPKTDRL